MEPVWRHKAGRQKITKEEDKIELKASCKKEGGSSLIQS
jgi:hypothetical protein